MKFLLQREQMEAERKRIEAGGIRMLRRLLIAPLLPNFLIIFG
ncbi:MAG: hypothetical protein ACUVUG_04655 [Candidatus Aminicenantia bacterium]